MPALDALKRKGTAAKVAEVLARSFIRSVEYSTLITAANTVLEMNIVREIDDLMKVIRTQWLTTVGASMWPLLGDRHVRYSSRWPQGYPAHLDSIPTNVWR